MNSNTLTIKTDHVGDTFVKEADKYTSKDAALLDAIVEQQEKNFETAFGSAPSTEELGSALKFVELFCAELAEVFYQSQEARAAILLSRIVCDEDTPARTILSTAEQMADIAETIQRHYPGNNNLAKLFQAHPWRNRPKR